MYHLRPLIQPCLDPSTVNLHERTASLPRAAWQITLEVSRTRRAVDSRPRGALVGQSRSNRRLGTERQATGSRPSKRPTRRVHEHAHCRPTHHGASTSTTSIVRVHPSRWDCVKTLTRGTGCHPEVSRSDLPPSILPAPVTGPGFRRISMSRSTSTPPFPFSPYHPDAHPALEHLRSRTRGRTDPLLR